MKAIARDAYGPPEKLQVREVARPKPTDDEVLIRVRASSVNHADYLLTTGAPWSIRLATGVFRPRQPVLGVDVAGEIVELGENVRGFAVGDAVYAESFGAYAEYVAVAANRVAPMPKSVSFEEAATLPVAAGTALFGLTETAKVKPGDEVLINGASGGVGTFAVQIAKALGARVTGVCRTHNVAHVRAIGADHVIDATHEDFTAGPARYDVILDLVGSRSIAACRGVLTPKGVYVSSVGKMGFILRAFVMSLFTRRVVVLVSQTTSVVLNALTKLVESGAVRPVIEARYRLEEVPLALRRHGDGPVRGKAAITIGTAA